MLTHKINMKYIPTIIELIAIALVASILSLLAILALDSEILQNERDLESFRSQGFSLSPSPLKGDE